MRVLKVPVDARGYYRAYLEFLSPLLTLNKQDRDVLGELLYKQYCLKSVPEQYRKGVLDREFRREICGYLGIKLQSFYNGVSRLRKAGVLLGDRLNSVYVFDYDTDRQVVIEFVDNKAVDARAGQGTGHDDQPPVL